MNHRQWRRFWRKVRRGQRVRVGGSSVRLFDVSPESRAAAVTAVRAMRLEGKRS